MKAIAFDEAGYTGQDLSNTDQPVFTLSSVNLTPQEADILLSCITTKAEEVKFNRLRKFPKFENELEKLLNHELVSDSTVRIAIAHKEYMIIAQTVDKLIEPIAHNDGLDLYSEGMNLAFTNMLYKCLPVLCDESIIKSYNKAFVQMFKNKQSVDIDNFYTITEQLINSSIHEELKSSLYLILHSYPIIDKILESVDSYHLDVSSTCCAVLTDYWGKKLNEKFDIIADDSKPLEHYGWFFNRIKSNEIPPQEIGYGSRKMTFPLLINDFKFGNSKDFKQIQVADLIAGASAYFGKSLINSEKSDSLSEMIGQSKIAKLFYPIWPHDSVTPEELNMDKSGNNPVDAMMTIIKDK